MTAVTRPVCPACSDKLVITYGGQSVECPLHDGPVTEPPADVADHILAAIAAEPKLAAPKPAYLAAAFAFVVFVLALGVLVMIMSLVLR